MVLITLNDFSDLEIYKFNKALDFYSKDTIKIYYENGEFYTLSNGRPIIIKMVNLFNKYLNGDVKYDCHTEECEKQYTDIVRIDRLLLNSREFNKNNGDSGDSNFIDPINGEIVNTKKMIIYCRYCYNPISLIDNFFSDENDGSINYKKFTNEEEQEILKSLKDYLTNCTPFIIGEYSIRIMRDYIKNCTVIDERFLDIYERINYEYHNEQEYDVINI